MASGETVLGFREGLTEFPDLSFWAFQKMKKEEEAGKKWRRRDGGHEGIILACRKSKSGQFREVEVGPIFCNFS